jgi:hypothetical protein
MDVVQHGEEAYSHGEGALLMPTDALPRPWPHPERRSTPREAA